MGDFDAVVAGAGFLALAIVSPAIAGRDLAAFGLRFRQAPVPWTAAACRRAGVVHVGDSVRAMSKAVWEAFYGLLPARPTLILGQPVAGRSEPGPGRQAPPVELHHVPTRPVGDALQPQARTDWGRCGAAFAERMEATIEAHAPGFRELVLTRRIWTSVDLEAANPNVVGGDINGGSFAIDQQLLFRPGLDWWRWGTRSRGLYLAGTAVPPGARVHGACGDLAARQALADRHRPARLAAAAALGMAMAAL